VIFWALYQVIRLYSAVHTTIQDMSA